MRFRNLSIVTTVFTYLTILVGGFTRGSGAGLGCSDNWPRCTETSFFPVWSDELMVIEWSHRLVALIAGVLILWMAVAAWRSQKDDKRILAAATIAAVLLPLQAYLGALTVWHHLDPYISATHMGTAAALFGAVVATTIFAWYPRDGAPARAGLASDQAPGTADPAPGSRPELRDVVTLFKPRIILLLMAMGATGIVLAPGGLSIGLAPAIWTLLGGGLAAGAAGIINQVIERDLDAQMDRTHHRPLVHGRIRVKDALALAATLIAVAFTMLAFMVNVLAAVLAMLAVVLYVFVYTLWLKPASPQGVVVGGTAGAAPALVGWAAVTGDIGVPALLLGLLVFLWQPPHFWALAIARKDDYEAAGFPMMPSVRGLSHTKRQMVLYTLATILTAGLLYVWTSLGMIYLVASTVLGLAFLWATLRVTTEHAEPQARSLFWVSIAYLGLLFLAIAVDRLTVLWL